MKVSARCFVEYDSIADLIDMDFEEFPKPLLHIGGGSNLLFTDDYKGTVLHSKIDFIEILSEAPADDSTVLVSVGAGVKFDDFCRWAAEKGLWGIENLSYIPGETGASAVQNIGAYGVEVKDVIKTVYCYDLQEEEFIHLDVSECGYGYRDSNFKGIWKGRYVVTHVVFALKKDYSPDLSYGHLNKAVEEFAAGAPVTPMMVRKVIIRIRKEKLPDVEKLGSAGSFFKNPVVSVDHFDRIKAWAREKYGQDYVVPHYMVESGESCMVKVPAAWMIEQCGWKGKRSGGAAVYQNQPLVIVNFTGEAYPEEIIALERKIKASVKDLFEVELQPEVEHI